MILTYGDNLKTESTYFQQKDFPNVETTKELYQSISLHNIRGTCNKELSQDHTGKVSQCKKYNTRISSTDIIKKCVEYAMQSILSGAYSNEIMIIDGMT